MTAKKTAGTVVTRETVGNQELKQAAKPQSSNASQEVTACLLNELVMVSMIVWMAVMRLCFASLSALQVTRVDQTKLVCQPREVLPAVARKAGLWQPPASVRTSTSVPASLLVLRSARTPRARSSVAVKKVMRWKAVTADLLGLSTPSSSMQWATTSRG